MSSVGYGRIKKRHNVVASGTPVLSFLHTHVCCCRLMPGVSVLPLLERNPSLLFSVQRGSATLGPGAEFMGQG
jgi:hypothetical protein